MPNVYIEARPKGCPGSSPVDDRAGVAGARSACQLSCMSEEAHAAPGRVIRVTPNGPGEVFPKRALFAVAIGDDQQALDRFKRAYPDLDAVVEIVGDLCEESLQDLGLKPGLLVPL